MSLPTKRSLGDMRQELRDRLGFAATGSQAGPNTSIMNSFLKNGQVQLYWQFDWPQLKKVDKTTITNQGQIFYDWPDDIHPDRLVNIAMEDTSSATPNIWSLVEGIDWKHDNYATPQDQPSRFERRDQLEIWPEPNSNDYKIWIEYVKRLDAFSIDTDKATLDEDLILLHALAASKAHYRHKDAEIYGGQIIALLARLKAGGLGHKRFIRKTGKVGAGSYGEYFNNAIRHKHAND